MREHKYRAWDTINKKMLTPLSGILWGKAVVPTDYVQGLFNGEVPLNYSYFAEGEMLLVENAELMQYIGRRNRLGKEIYEGDIVKGDTGGICAVMWEEDIDRDRFWATANGFGIDFCGSHAVGDSMSHADGELEIIGNVWETPDLVKVQL